MCTSKLQNLLLESQTNVFSCLVVMGTSMNIPVEDFGEMQSSMTLEVEPKKLGNGSLVENSIKFTNEKPKIISVS